MSHQKTNKPTSRERSESRFQFRRKAAFFAVVAAESLSEIEEAVDDRTSAMWIQASKMLSQTGNTLHGGCYGWATLRSVALHGLAIQGLREASEVAAVQLLSLMSEISPKRPVNDPAVFFAKADEDYEESGDMDDRSTRSDGFGPTTAESVRDAARAARTAVKDARTFVQEARSKRPSFFSGANVPSSLLAVAQSRWVEDDEISPILLPMSDLSDISNSIIAMRSVWSAIRFQNCVVAQKKVIGQISDLRSNMPASTLPSQAKESKSSFLPIKITAVSILDSEGSSSLERVKTKNKTVEKTGAMATFFNPYADKKGEAEATLLPQGEERYISVKFANRLAVPLEIPRCQLEFTAPQSDQIKAPAISFVIPGETDNFSVQFPFMILAGRNGSAITNNEDPVIYEVKRLHATCLGRSFFLPIGGSHESKRQDESEDLDIPLPASRYPRRKYTQDRKINSEAIQSPRLEIVPAQPNLLMSFAASSAPMDDGTVIPAPIADGEVYDLPRIILSNESGVDGMGAIKELQIIALGLPGKSKTILFELNGDAPSKNQEESKKDEKESPLTLTATADGIDFNYLNKKQGVPSLSSVSLQLSAAANMGSFMKGGSVTIRFRYRGEAPSLNLQVWRKREILVGVVRTKGPRISSLTFRPDLSWESAYSTLCKSIAHEEKQKHRYCQSKSKTRDAADAGITDEEDFVSHRLGKDPGVHVCSDKLVALVTVANETSSPIILSKSNENVGGFEGIPIETMRVSPGVSAKIPMILQRIDRKPEISEQLVNMTKLSWKSDLSSGNDGSATETGGTMVPLNARVRKGCIQIPSECLKFIVDENKTILSRICKSPFSINVGIVGDGGGNTFPIKPGVPVETSVEVEFADWVPEELLNELDFRLKFCCAPKDSSRIGLKRDFIWSGQIRKSLDSTEKRHSHRARVLFLNEGDYVVSACVSLGRSRAEDDIKEVWWAQRAQNIHVLHVPISQ